MKKVFFLLLNVVIFSCSSEVEEPEVITNSSNKPNEEIILDENDPSDGPVVSIPFSLSIVLKEMENSNALGDDFLLVNFIEGKNEPEIIENISKSYDIPTGSRIYPIGIEDILNFVNTNAASETNYTGIDLNTNNARFISRNTLFEEVDDSCDFSIGLVWGSNNLFSIYNNQCGEVNVVKPFVKSSTEANPVIIGELSNAFAGDSGHKIWATRKFLIVHYDNNANDGGFQQDGLVVYNSNTLMEVFSLTSERPMALYIDNNLLAIQYLGAHLLQLIDLDNGNVLYNQDISELAVNASLVNADITTDRMGTFDNQSSAIFVPAYYDFITKEIISVDRDKYMAFFNRDSIDFSADIIEPIEIKFDLQSNSFATSYAVFEPGFLQGLKFMGVMFMDFDGNLLYNYQLPDDLYIQQLVKRE